MEKNPIKKLSKIEQLLPDYITSKIILKQCLCIKVPKKETSSILSRFKQKNLLIDKVFLKEINYHSFNFDKDFQKPIKEELSNYQLYDCSFLKRVKNYNDKENLIIISFMEDLAYKKIDEESIIKEYNFNKENLIRVDVPCTEPISNDQYIKNNKIWPLCNYISSKEKFIHNHQLEEEREILELFNKYLISNNSNIDVVDSILYDPNKKEVIVKSKKNNNSITGHSIMNLLDKHSQILKDRNNINKHESFCELKLGEKNVKGPEDNTFCLFGDNDGKNRQYYCEGLFVLTREEPCIMCSMALIHNRISRLYFSEVNPKEGALISKYSLDNYNLNHHYLVYKLD